MKPNRACFWSNNTLALRNKPICFSLSHEKTKNRAFAFFHFYSQNTFIPKMLIFKNGSETYEAERKFNQTDTLPWTTFQSLFPLWMYPFLLDWNLFLSWMSPLRNQQDGKLMHFNQTSFKPTYFYYTFKQKCLSFKKCQIFQEQADIESMTVSDSVE